jgi:hypothetical protein
VIRSLDQALRSTGMARPGVLLRTFYEGARGRDGSDNGVLARTLSYLACLFVEQVGATILFFGHEWGLYVVCIGMMTSFLFIVSGAWLLLVGVDSEARNPAP